MARAFCVLLGSQWLGEVLARLGDLPVPGPVLGMAFLLVALVLRGRRAAHPDEKLRGAASGLLAHLSLMFVPAGVGVIVHLERLEAAALPLAAVVVGGTAVALGATGVLASAILGGRARA